MANLIGYGAAQVFPESDPGKAIREYATNLSAKKKQKDKDQDTYGEAPFKIEDVKRWEDERNYNELLGMEQTLRETWNESYQSGYNIRNPQTPEDVVLSKKYYQAWNKFEEASQLYETQGERVADTISQIDKLKPEEIDAKATQENLERYINAPSVFERTGMLDSLIVRREEEFDGMEYLTDMLPKLAPTQKFIKSEDIDEKTGKIRKKTWEGVPLAARKEAITQLYNAGDGRFKNYVDELRESNVDKTMDNPDWSNAEFAAEYFSNVKEGGKENVIYYGSGGGFTLGLGYGAGKPAKTDDGQFVNNEDSIFLFNRTRGGKAEHTSPFQIGLTNDKLFGKKSAHMPISVSDQIINAESGEQEAIASGALFRPNKIVWLPVVSGEQQKGMGGLWDNITSLLNPNKYTKGSILSDEDLQKIQTAMQENPGTSSNYIWRPYVTGMLGYERKEGTIGDDERIINLNRSVYVPYEDIADDFQGKFEQWDKAIGTDIVDITKQANFGLAPTSQTKEIDFNSLGL